MELQKPVMRLLNIGLNAKLHIPRAPEQDCIRPGRIAAWKLWAIQGFLRLHRAGRHWMFCQSQWGDLTEHTDTLLISQKGQALKVGRF